MSTLRTADDLIAAGLLDEASRSDAARVAARYAIAVTPTLAGRMAPGDALARQFVPDPAELETTSQESADPIGDVAHSPVPGIVHRYPDRALLKLVSVCAVYCRFCFRREMVGPGRETALSPDALEAAFAYLAAHPEIWEVILTGGDPLMLAPRRMRDVLARLAELGHVRIARFHTRIPIAAPERVDAAMVEALKVEGLTSYVVIHANHAAELGPEARIAIARLVDAGIPVLSQSVLLRGVNDTPETLADLFRALVECRVKPYYLHHPDFAPGTAHFRLSITEGQDLMRALRGRLSGLCLPTYVLDIPGGYGKVPLTPSSVQDGHVIDYCGGVHAYPPEPIAPR
ncbi:lysine-2,3-aminomutase-like protein [Aquabacter spiritensis]|uniref:L-lysine 2,3-aminomutase n=1 Tax=Aquabacter spiritensis TaxID=933073 RepID=A0A4R3LVJ1_9HYPH|nr:lysine-2,3-aminomutase-like protein [Aquabacter spiritensis]TCT04650.1 L-lysine 2,3-aminomutase [Aquabacter spiritensis]